MLAGGVSVTSGCKAFFPRDTTRAETRWKTFNEAQDAFEKIVPNQTTKAELRTLGFDPFTTPNVKILTYLDVTTRFLPNASVCKEDLHEAVRRCLESKDTCRAYELELTNTHCERYGNLVLDVLGFKRQSRTTGWNFKGLILLRDEVVVYKLGSGQPDVDRWEEKIKPLGPLQELDHVLLGAVPKPH
jgi:hypothetical protein